MDHPHIADIHETRHLESFGKKGGGLHWLSRHRLAIPHTLVLTHTGAQQFSADPTSVMQALAPRIDPHKDYAVRSSANLEDDKDSSFAGQFTSHTNVRGLETLQASIEAVLASGRSESLKPYLQKLGERGRQLQMAVLIQEMVKPVISGVAFSKNPTTGLDEVVIESVHGLGEALMQEGITPERWIYRWGQFTSRSDRDKDFEPVIRQIAEETRRIAKLYAAPVDLEWAYDGHKVYWLQIRPITTLTNVPLYSNRISREVLPGIIKPLIASINIPLVNTAWIRLFDSLMGPTNLKPEDLTRIFHYRAYFNMGAIGTIFEILGFPRESLEILLGFQVKGGRPKPSLQTFRHIPRIVRFAAQAWSYDKRVATELAGYESAIREFQKEEVGHLSEQELSERIERLFRFNVLVAYQNIVIPILMGVYNAMLKGRLKKLGVDFVNFDVMAGLAEMQQYDPNFHLDRLKETIENLPEEEQTTLRTASFAALAADPRFAAFTQQVRQFIAQFGHLSDSGNDFSRTPWREDPGHVVQMALNHAASGRNNQKVTWETLPASGFTKLRMRSIYTRARNFRLKREQVSSMYTASYGWFRVYFTALANRLIARGLLQQPDDIYHLSWQEVQALLQTPARAEELQAAIRTRRAEIEKSRDIALPEIIYGNTPPPLSLMRPNAQKLTGIPTSSGYFQGPLKVVRSTEDFHKVQPGDVIAIPYSDVAWTPLFARAGAVVAEAGGILSHSSIVAREYGIPCVVSVNNACNLPENVEVIVDGYQGAVQIVQ